MSISLLEAHRVEPPDYDSLKGPHLFDLNSDFAGISITDQMRRGHGIIVEALRNKIIGPDRPLLIVGAGVAGMMAAATAAKNKVPTAVIEKEKKTFSVQANRPSRWVCPTQYSWPESGWNRGAYPRDNRAMPFVWRRGVASVEIDTKRKEVEKFLRESGYVEIFRNIEFTGYSITRDSSDHRWVIPRLSASPEDPKLPLVFAMALACTGFGEENTVLKSRTSTPPANTYTGHIFWHLDKYETDNPHLGISSGEPNVLISGSGDGALQDFLRIATRVDAADVAGEDVAREEDRHRAGSAGALYWLTFKDRPLGRRISRTIKDIEQRYHNELADACKPHRDKDAQTLHKCSVNAEAHVAHLNLIKELCNEPRSWRRVIHSLDPWVKNLRDEIRIKMVYPCCHVSPYYGLNRFMTLLVLAYAYERYPDVQLVYPGTQVTEIVGTGPHAAPDDTCKNAEHCHGKDHRVFCAPAPDCLSIKSRVTGQTEFEGGPYNAVIVRHGIHPRPNVLTGGPLAGARA